MLLDLLQSDGQCDSHPRKTYDYGERASTLLLPNIVRRSVLQFADRQCRTVAASRVLPLFGGGSSLLLLDGTSRLPP